MTSASKSQRRHRSCDKSTSSDIECSESTPDLTRQAKEEQSIVESNDSDDTPPSGYIALVSNPELSETTLPSLSHEPQVPL